MKKTISFFLLCICSLTSCNYTKVKEKTLYVDKLKEKNDNKQMVESVTEITPGVIEQKKMNAETEENRDTNEDAANVYDEIINLPQEEIDSNRESKTIDYGRAEESEACEGEKYCSKQNNNEIDSESVSEDFDNEDSLPDIVYEDGEIPNDSPNYYEYSDDEFSYYVERGEEE